MSDQAKNRIWEIAQRVKNDEVIRRLKPYNAEAEDAVLPALVGRGIQDGRERSPLSASLAELALPRGNVKREAIPGDTAAAKCRMNATEMSLSTWPRQRRKGMEPVCQPWAYAPAACAPPREISRKQSLSDGTPWPNADDRD